MASRAIYNFLDKVTETRKLTLNIQNIQTLNAKEKAGFNHKCNDLLFYDTMKRFIKFKHLVPCVFPDMLQVTNITD